MVGNRQVFAVSPKTLGTIREFNSITNLKIYVWRAKNLPKAIMEKKPKHFEIQPVQILDIDRKGRSILERVFPSPSLWDILNENRDSRYYNNFIKKLERKKISREEAMEIAVQAYFELCEISRAFTLTELEYDLHESNVLVLDIDKKTKKALFAIIDTGGSIGRL